MERSAVVAWGGNYSDQTTVPANLTGVQAIAAGESHTVALKNDGTVVAWGSNYYGQTAVPDGLTGVQAIAAGRSHTVALKSDGSVIAWGYNAFRQTVVPNGLAGVRAIAAGGYHTVALKNDGTVVAWGSNAYGQTTVPGGLSGVQAIAAGFNFTVALKSNGTVVAWGKNDDGQTAVPSGLTGVQAIAAGEAHTIALKADGTVVSWGKNDEGQSTVPAGLTKVRAIVAGYLHSVALKSDGTVVAWGWNNDGQTTVPTGLTGVQAVAAGPTHTVALVRVPSPAPIGVVPVGSVTTPVNFMIRNGGDQILTLGEFMIEGPNADEFVVSAPGSTVVAPAGAVNFTVTFRPQAAGRRSALLHIPNNDPMATPFEIALSARASVNWTDSRLAGLTLSEGVLNEKFDSVLLTYTANVTHRISSFTVIPTCADGGASVTVNGASVISGTSSDRLPLAVGENIVTIAVTAADGVTKKNYALIVTRAGLPSLVVEQVPGTPLLVKRRVVAWGRNDQGQMTVPSGLSEVVAVAAGGHHIVALKMDGTLVAWGNNFWGQATPPSGLTGVEAIAAGDYFTVALKHDGTVAVWGEPTSHQTKVPSDLTGVQAVAAGERHVVALKDDGTVVAWGANDQGQTRVPIGLTRVQAIAANRDYTSALKADGTVESWGDGRYGPVMGLIDVNSVQAIAAGEGHTVALKADGTVVAWGSNVYGQTAVPNGLTGVQAIAAGGVHTVALKSDGTVVAWGGNSYGQTAVPGGLMGVQAIAAGPDYTVALVRAASPATVRAEAVGSTGRPVKFTIRNTGTADLTLGAFIKDGPNADEFAISTPGSTTIVPGWSTTFTVTFTPGALGERTAMLRIPSNDPTTSPFAIALSGSGVLPSAPVITAQPASRVATLGRTLVLAIEYSGTPVPAFQWYKDGVAIPGATDDVYTVAGVTSAQAGTYTVTLTNSEGAATSSAAVVRVAPPQNTLANLSVRAGMEAQQTLILGFVVSGGSKPVLVRAGGPGLLETFGFQGYLFDPQLSLHAANGDPIANNDNWDSALADTFARLGAFPFRPGSKDAAVLATVTSANTAHAPAGTTPGVQLVELYDAGENNGVTLTNVSARNRCGTGNDVLIAGFVIAGEGKKWVLIRGIGPGLARKFGVPGVLADPKLTLFNASGQPIASNDDWDIGLASTFQTLGAFDLGAGSKDAALLIELDAGVYTAQVAGADGGTGEALVEVYDAKP